MKIGVYGGTFNPIHLGHVHILREFIQRLKLDKGLLIPARVPPHKQALDLAEGTDRLAMCRLAAAELEGLAEVSALELERPGRSYTVDTLRELSTRYPEDEFYLLMGEDMFLTVDRWYCAETIFRLAAICASPRSRDGAKKLREKQGELEGRYHARCFVEDIPYLPISSTEIREAAEAGKSLKGLVPPGVERYIVSHRLYGKSDGVESNDL